TWAMSVTGWLIDRYGARVPMSLAAVMCGIGWAALGTAQSLMALYLYYALAGLGAAIVYCGALGVALKWFPDRRGFAAGIISVGFGSGSALSVPVIEYLLKTHDYRFAFLTTGIAQGVLILVASQFLSGKATPAFAAAKVATKPKTRTHEHDFN